MTDHSKAVTGGGVNQVQIIRGQAPQRHAGFSVRDRPCGRRSFLAEHEGLVAAQELVDPGLDARQRLRTGHRPDAQQHPACTVELTEDSSNVDHP
jgi:hypothetical protein